MRHTIIPAIFFASAVLALMIAGSSLHAQTFTVLHNFTGGGDGARPYAGLTIDAAGNLYGTTEYGGNGNFGTVFKLTPRGSGWVLNPLYSFQGGSEGQNPQDRVSIAPNRTLYGTTSAGGTGGFSCPSPSGCGTIFHLVPPPRACTTALCPWSETVLYRFDPNIGGSPGLGSLTFDQSGNLYGTQLGNMGTSGEVYELAFSNGQWTFQVLSSFSSGETDNPDGGVIFDSAGNLYGTSVGAPFMHGAVFELTSDGQLWSENTLWDFCGGGGNDGSNPVAGLIFDPFGNLYGTTQGACDQGAGAVYALMRQSGSWTESVLHLFTGSDGASPSGTLTIDSAGSLYGTTAAGGQHSLGTVFKLSPSGGQWILTDLHDFDGSDGSSPVSSNVVLDAHGNLYGTTSQGGAFGQGVVWKINP